MPSNEALAAIVAVLCFWLAVLLFAWLVRTIARREVKRALTGLRNAKFALTIRDPKTGRFVK